VLCLSQVSFPSLGTLDLTANRLSAVWTEGWQLPLLSRLNLSKNRALTALPEAGWAGMPRLRELHLSMCALSTLPPALAELTALRLLDVSGNLLASAPAELGELHALKDCDVSCNQLECLPSAWAGMTQLRRLNAENNRLTGLPREILDMHTLDTIKIKGNPLTMKQLEGVDAYFQAQILKSQCPSKSAMSPLSTHFFF